MLGPRRTHQRTCRPYRSIGQSAIDGRCGEVHRNVGEMGPPGWSFHSVTHALHLQMGLNGRWGRRCWDYPHLPWECPQTLFCVRLIGAVTVGYSRSPKNPALTQLQKSFKSASTTPQRPIWNSFATVGVWDFWENGCIVGTVRSRYRRQLIQLSIYTKVAYMG